MSTSDQTFDKRFAKCCVRRLDGTCVFYPNGITFRGYLIPDDGREQAVRQGYRRYLYLNKLFFRYPLWCLGFVTLLGFAATVEHPSSDHLCIFALPILLGTLLNRAVLSSQLGPLLAGMEYIDGERAGQRNFAVLIGGSLAAAGLMWIVSCSYAERISEIPINSAIVSFYPDLSRLVLVSILCSLCLVSVFQNWRDLAVYIGPNSTVLLIFGAAILLVVLLFSSISRLSNPVPSIILTRDYISCQSRTRWSDIFAVSRSNSFHFREEYAVFHTNENTPSLPSKISCKISDLNVSSYEAYSAIKAAWTSASFSGVGK